MAMNNYLSIITLNINGLNAPIKRHRIAEWMRKHDPHICCLQETHLRTKDLHRLKVKGWKQIFQANGQEKKSWGSNNHIRQNRLQNKGHKKRPRRSLHNTQRKNPSRRHKHCKHTWIPPRSTQIYKKILEDFKKDIDSNTIIVGDFNTPLSKMDRSSKQNINKDIVALNNVLDQMDLTDIYKTFHPKEAKYTFFFHIHMEHFQRQTTW